MAFVGTVISLTVPATVTTGTAVAIKHLMPEKSIQFTGMLSGTFSLATLQIMGSNDGANFEQLGSDVTTNGIVSVTAPVQFIRIDRTVGTTGTITATLCGFGPNYGA
jgi:hypothetical protein